MNRFFRNMRFLGSCIFATSMAFSCSASQAASPQQGEAYSTNSHTSVYWSDGDSGRLGKMKFRLANIDAPETGSIKQRGGAKCEYEREIGYEAKAYIVGFTKDKTIRILRDYGEDRYGRLVVDLDADVPLSDCRNAAAFCNVMDIACPA